MQTCVVCHAKSRTDCKQTYASVLMFGDKRVQALDLTSELFDVNTIQILPSLTTYCSTCRKVQVLVPSGTSSSSSSDTQNLMAEFIAKKRDVTESLAYYEKVTSNKLNLV